VLLDITHMQVKHVLLIFVRVQMECLCWQMVKLVRSVKTIPMWIAVNAMMVMHYHQVLPLDCKHASPTFVPVQMECLCSQMVELVRSAKKIQQLIVVAALTDLLYLLLPLLACKHVWAVLKSMVVLAILAVIQMCVPMSLVI
tara:strand:+ start:270 stop:695 length:426 start_codon:yes stop_codon:yes gene_type:complete